jgi:hypothetical protein
VIAAFRPVLRTPPRPEDPDSSASLVVRSFLLLRTLVGALGIALPVVVVFLDKVAFDEEPFFRNSLSAYYYSGVRDIFVAILSSIGVFFVAYKIARAELDNTLSSAAGVCALVVAIFPTRRPSYVHVPLTPLQKLLSERAVSWVHFAGLALLIASLTVMSILFGIREGARPRRRGQLLSAAHWRAFHYTCGGLMAAGLLWMGITYVAGGPSNALLIGEWICTWAFGASWLAKGAELDVLRKCPAPAVTPPPTASGTAGAGAPVGGTTSSRRAAARRRRR